MKLINCCPHKFNFVINGKEVLNVPPTHLIRLETAKLKIGETPEGIPILETEYLGSASLPPVESGTLYIVSQPVALAFKGVRRDFVVGENYIRNEKGEIIGAEAISFIK